MKGKLRILVVDDEEDFLELAKNFLENKQKEISVEIAPSGKRALEMIKDNPYDVIVADYKMPEMDGLELLKRIRENDIDTLFYILTGKGEEETSERALELGASGYFHKTPLSNEKFDKLYEMLVKSIEKRQNTDRHLIAWITVRKGWGEIKYEKLENALNELSEIIGFEISNIRKREVAPEKEKIKAHTENYSDIPTWKSEAAKKWEEIVTKEPEIVDAGLKTRKIQPYN